MWIFTKEGFFSAVEVPAYDSPGHEGEVQVRARNPEHLENLRKRYSLTEEVVSLGPHRDYGSRIYLDKEKWSNIVTDLVQSVDYDDFKTSVKNSGADSEYIDFLSDVWAAGYAYQEGHAGFPGSR